MECEVSGYCRTYNQYRIAECRVEREGGQAVIAEMECNYERCLNRQDCQLVRQALDQAEN